MSGEIQPNKTKAVCNTQCKLKLRTSKVPDLTS
jgi:hypothetical protein